MRQAQINVRTRACSRTSIARTKQAALTHNVRGKELRTMFSKCLRVIMPDLMLYDYCVECGSSVVECRTRNRESPDSNPSLLVSKFGHFRSLHEAPVRSAG